MANEIECKDEPHTCAGIQYKNEAGQGVHSDLCTGVENWDDPEYRKLLHDNLDELLNSKDAEGLFFVGLIVSEDVD